MDTRLEDITKHARSRATGCRKRSDEHAISFHRWNRWSRILAMVTAGLAGLGGVGAITAAKTGTTLAAFAGAIVILSVLARAVDEGLGARKIAEEHKLASVRFRELRLLFLNLGKFPPEQADVAEGRLIEIQAQEVKVEAESPLVEAKAQRIRERLERESKEAGEAPAG